jgi:hypothetical protein
MMSRGRKTAKGRELLGEKGILESRAAVEEAVNFMIRRVGTLDKDASLKALEANRGTGS